MVATPILNRSVTAVAIGFLGDLGDLGDLVEDMGYCNFLLKTI
jgi:hypothetical protein